MRGFKKSVAFITKTVLREEQEIKLVFYICYIYISSISISLRQYSFFLT